MTAPATASYTEPTAPTPELWRGDDERQSLGASVLMEISAELLRLISGALDVRPLFSRVSAIAARALDHDALVLLVTDHDGQATVRTCAPSELPAHDWPAMLGSQEHAIVDELRLVRTPWGRNAGEGVGALVTAGYASAITVVRAANGRNIRLTFLSSQPHAYTASDVPVARHIADCLAVAVAHEHLAAGDCDEVALEAGTRTDARLNDIVQKALKSGARNIIGNSGALQQVLARAARVAPTEATVLLRGQSGTGKELVARFIHQTSPRSNGPFVAINCAALPDQLLESELFGYERGAFTGAHQAKPGHIEMAARGVLFLDEVGEMNLAAQAKFLRFLEEREFHRLGGTRTQKANVRVIAATNRDLRQAVAQGTFREDLYYRLQVFEIEMPALSERVADIPLLADHFLAEFAAATGGRPARLTADAARALLAHRWPGNIRELRNVLESAAIVADNGVIERRHLTLRAAPLPPSAAASPASAETLGALERQMIESTLRRTDGNRSETARLLGLTRTQLYVRLRRYGIGAALGPSAA